VEGRAVVVQGKTLKTRSDDMKKKLRKPAAPAPEQQAPAIDVPQHLTEKELAARLSLSPATLRDWRKKTPKNWTGKRMKEAAARGEVIYPPFVKLGNAQSSAVRYLVVEVNIWLSLQPHWGRLPEGVVNF
jgi:DNA-binding transcriptional regulator YiaG